MKCKNCGATLLDTDKFCDQCGWKVVRKRKCPECGAPLREGTKFCPKCGRLIENGGSSNGEKVFVRDSQSADIPIADIEQNILSETERELHTPKKPRQTSAPKKKVPAPEPKKKERPAPVKKKVYRDWDDEEDEEDDDEEEDTGRTVMTIASVIMALLIVTLGVVMFFTIKRPIKDYEQGVEEEEQGGEEDGDGENNGEDNGGTEPQPEERNETDNENEVVIEPAGTLVISSDVNIRDNPSTEGTNIIKVAKAGEVYEYIETTQDGNWYAILLEDGSTAYVFEKYVSVN